MPILNVKVSAKKSAALTKAIAGTLSDLTARILHKKPELTAIAIDYVDPDDWIVGGKSLSEQGMNSFYFDIKITDEMCGRPHTVSEVKRRNFGFITRRRMRIGRDVVRATGSATIATDEYDGPDDSPGRSK